MNTFKMILIIVCMIFSVPAGNISVARTEEKETPEWIRLVSENRAHLTGLVGDKAKFSEDVTRFVTLLKHPDDPVRWGDSDREFHVNALYDLGRFPNGFENDTGYLEDSIVVKILVSALKDPRKKIRNSVFSRLLRFARASRLGPHSGDIKNAFGKYEFPDEHEMLGLLTLDENERKLLLGRDDVPAKVRARIGDTDSENRLISEFGASDDFEKKERLADDLAYVGTGLCGKALAESLASGLISKGIVEEVSIKFFIISALGKIHPDNHLLTREIKKIEFLGDDDYGGSEAIRNYLGEVCQWAENAYGIQLPEPDPDSVLYRHIVIGRPIPIEPPK